MKFVDIVLALLQEKGISKNKMLTDLALGKNSFVNWTTRGTVPGGDTLQKIADYFGVTTDYLLGKEDKPGGHVFVSYRREEVPDPVTAFSPEEAAILEKIKLLDEEGTAQLLSYLDYLLLQQQKKFKKTVKVYMAARSTDHHDAEVVEMDAQRLDKLKKAPETDDPL